MKRSPPNSPERDTKPDISIPSGPATPKKPRKLPNSKDMKSPSPRKTSDQVGGWTADKREIMIPKILTAGYSAIDAAALAAELGVSRLQLKNAMQAGRPGNCRDKAIKAVKGG